MIEFETEDRELVSVLITCIIAFEKLTETTTLVVLNHGVEYVAKSTYSDIKDVMIDFYLGSERTDENNIVENTEDQSYMASTYTQEERLTYIEK